MVASQPERRRRALLELRSREGVVERVRLEALRELRDEQRIDDIVLRRIQAGLDVEEVRISRANPLAE